MKLGIRFGSELIRGSLDLMVLAVLAEGPNYGYQIQKRLRSANPSTARLDAGTLYPLLHRLESDGVIRSRWDKASGRQRKWYQLTPAGRRRLRTQAHQWKTYVTAIEKLLRPALAALPVSA